MSAAAGPRKAILLAAGLGARMRPLSFDTPKPLMPLWGAPTVLRVLRMLDGWGVREFLVNLHHEPGPVFDALRNEAGARGLRVQFSYEPELLDTGGALRRAAWFLDDRPFWLVNTDIAAELSPVPLLRAHAALEPLATLWLSPDRGPRTVEVRAGLVTSFRSATPGAEGTCTFCGLHLLSPRVLRFVPPEESEFSIITAYASAMAAGERIAGVPVPGAYWADAGRAESYLDIHADLVRRHGARAIPAAQRRRLRQLRAGGVALAGAVSVGEDVRVAPGAAIRDSVVWDGADLGPHTRLDRAVVGRGVTLDRALSGVAVRADRLPAGATREVLGRLGWKAGATAVLPLAPRGSDRVFTRLVAGRRSAILIEYGTQRDENARTAGIARFLAAHGVPVPAVLLDDPVRRLQVMADAGDVSLEAAYPGLARRTAERVYGRVIDSVRRLHAIPVARAARLGLQPGFDRALYEWEHRLFAEHLLRRRLRMPESQVRALLRECQGLARTLARVQPVLVHRDLQSSNILLRGGRPVLIDFQGLRQGAAAYDLGSLLCDPYVMLPGDLRARLLDRYLDGAPQQAEVRGLFWPASAQRLVQALGAFSRLAASRGTERFSRYIPSGLRMLGEALGHLDGMPLMKETVARAFDSHV